MSSMTTPDIEARIVAAQLKWPFWEIFRSEEATCWREGEGWVEVWYCSCGGRYVQGYVLSPENLKERCKHILSAKNSLSGFVFADDPDVGFFRR